MSVSAPFRGHHYWIRVVLSQTDSCMSQSSRGETPRGMDGSSTDPFQLWYPCSNKLTLGVKEKLLNLLTTMAFVKLKMCNFRGSVLAKSAG